MATTTASWGLISLWNSQSWPRLDIYNWNALRSEVVYVLNVKSYVRFIGLDDSVAKKFDEMLYQWPQAPVANMSIDEGT